MKIYSTPSTTVMNAEVENAILVGSWNPDQGTNVANWQETAEGIYWYYDGFGMYYPCTVVDRTMTGYDRTQGTQTPPEGWRF